MLRLCPLYGHLLVMVLAVRFSAKTRGEGGVPIFCDFKCEPRKYRVQRYDLESVFVVLSDRGSRKVHRNGRRWNGDSWERIVGIRRRDRRVRGALAGVAEALDMF